MSCWAVMAHPRNRRSAALGDISRHRTVGGVGGILAGSSRDGASAEGDPSRPRWVVRVAGQGLLPNGRGTIGHVELFTEEAVSS